MALSHFGPSFSFDVGSFWFDMTPTIKTHTETIKRYFVARHVLLHKGTNKNILKEKFLHMQEIAYVRKYLDI
jgi:hypothetical protein